MVSALKQMRQLARGNHCNLTTCYIILTVEKLLLITISRPQERVGGAKIMAKNVQQNIVQRWSTSASNSDGPCAMIIVTDDQYSFSFLILNLAYEQPHLNLVRGVFICFKESILVK